jgi:hypothetical protein
MAKGTHGWTLLFPFAALAAQDLVSGLMLGLNHLMAGSHTPSGRGRFDVWIIPGPENNGRIAVAVLEAKDQGNQFDREGSDKRPFRCWGAPMGAQSYLIFSDNRGLGVRDQTVQCLGPRLTPLPVLSDGSAGSGTLH